MYTINDIFGREILNSLGEPTIEVVVGDGRNLASASVPTGISTGQTEALELRDNDPSRYNGKGVLKAIENINGIIAKSLLGNWDSMVEIDSRLIDLDGTPNKQRLGANTILAVSLACAKLFALQEKTPLYFFLREHFSFDDRPLFLPTPIANIVNGGQHSDNNLDIQEFWVIPSGISSYYEKLRAISEIFHSLGVILKDKKYGTAVGVEGGYSPNVIKENEEVWFLMEQAINNAKYKLGKEVYFGLDAGASSWNLDNDNEYEPPKQNIKLSVGNLKELYLGWFGRWPFEAIEDPFSQEDWLSWSDFTTTLKMLNPKISVIGDDIFTTNVERLKKGVTNKTANSLIIKPNQIGTLTETIACIRMAQKNNWKTVISHRSGETTDDFIADLAVAVGSEYVKFGAPSRSERLAKYNRLLVIESEIKANNF